MTVVLDVPLTLGVLLSFYLVANIFTGIATLQAWLYVQSSDRMSLKYLVRRLRSSGSGRVLASKIICVGYRSAFFGTCSVFSYPTGTHR